MSPSSYTNPDIICHKGATNAQLSVTVEAGGRIELQWSDWPTSHHGPVLTYLARCGGDCSTVDKTTLQFVKIDSAGLINDNTIPGDWASDQLIAASNSWTLTIPPSIAPGGYVLRHEIIALHSADEKDGAQNYPQCINLKVTGEGNDGLESGTLGPSLYNSADPGIAISIYSKLSGYVIPGPLLYSGGGSGGSGYPPSNTNSSSSSTATGVPYSPTTATTQASSPIWQNSTNGYGGSGYLPYSQIASSIPTASGAPNSSTTPATQTSSSTWQNSANDYEELGYLPNSPLTSFVSATTDVSYPPSTLEAQASSTNMAAVAVTTFITVVCGH